MNKTAYLFVTLLCFHTALPLMADVEVHWQPGGTHQHLKSFQEGDNFSGEDFRGSFFMDAGDIIGVNLDNTNFEGSRFVDMRIENTSFRGANLRSVNARDLSWSDPVPGRNVMPGCDFTDADITGSKLPLNAEQLRSTKSFKNKNLAGVTLWGMDLSGTSFAGFDLTDARFLHCNLEGCDFTDAVITKIEITGLTFGQLKGTKNYKEKDMGEILFMQCNFDDADFRGFKLGAFHGCSFRNADFRDAEFVKTTIQDRLYHYNGVRIGADTFGFTALFYRCGLIDSPLTRQQFESTRTFKSKDLSRMLLVLMNLDQWDFSDRNLDNTKLTHSSLKDANVTNASVQNTEFSYTNITREQWLSTKTFRGTEKFMPPTTRGIDMSNYDFSGMTIRGGSINVHPNFFDTNLTNANFTGATLINIGFEGCDLTGANFTDATLDGVRFTRSDLTWKQFLATNNGQARGFSDLSFRFFDHNHLKSPEKGGIIRRAVVRLCVPISE